jgi:hypothetical protein
VASAFEEGQRSLVRSGGFQRIVQQLTLLRRHVTVRGAMLNQEGRGRSRCVSDRVDEFDFVRHGLDRRADEQRLGRIGSVVGGRARSAGELLVHLQEIGRAEPIHHGLHAARLIGVAQIGPFQRRCAARSAQQRHQVPAG